MSVAARPATVAGGLASWLAPQRLVMLVFFIQSAEVNNWYPRIPDLQHQLGIGPAELSVALLGMPLGGFFAAMVVARLIEKLTARRTIMVGFAYTIAQFLPGWAWNVASLFVALALMGGTYVAIDISTNVEAARIQAELGRRIMSTCHGFWSLGSMLGLVMGSVFAQFAVDTRWHLLLVGVIALPLGLVTSRALPTFPAKEAGETRVPAISLPSRAMVGLCIFAFGVLLAELTTRNWGAVYVREAIGASPAAAGVAFAAFSLFMAIGRLFGDRLTDRFGPVALGRFCAAMAIAGVGVLLVAPNVAFGTIGFAALGVGVSVGFPLAVTAAASLGDRSPATNVAALALIAYTGAIVGPPLVGFVAQGAGLRAGLAAILPLMLLSALFAGSLKRRET